MAPRTPSTPSRDSAPDLEILGDQVVLHPSGYTEPAGREGKERNLVEHMAHFRTNPLDVSSSTSIEYVGS